MKYLHLAARLLDRPLLIEPRKLVAILAALGPRLDARVDWGVAAQAVEAKTAEAGYQVVDGVAMIPIVGSLVHRGGFMDAASGLTSYQGIDRQLTAALNDPSVRAIVLEIDSPGGEAAGVFDLADRIYAARGHKPITAIAVDQADSAAYLIASAADRVIATRTAELGSIGVVTAHVDMSQAAAKAGVAVTYIYAGEHKVDGNPYQPLPAEVKARVQGDIDAIYSMFVAAVARNRGLSEQHVRATQALTYLGPAAIEAGLADAIGSYESVFAELRSETAGALARRPSTQEEAEMPKPNEPEREPITAVAPESEPAAKAASAADIARACAAAGMPASAVAELIAAEPTSQAVQATVEAYLAEQAAEADRVSAIRDACAAAHQEDLAETFIGCGLSVAGARAVLDQMSRRGAEIDARQPPAAPPKRLNALEIYKQRRGAVGGK